ncbi:MAG: S8 family serine peptidase [Nitriliruptorales bacterium]|nr:S8 family serine peptidase [Nitriliruptorales bacterium]
MTAAMLGVVRKRRSVNRRGVAAVVLLALCLPAASMPNDPLADRQYHLRRVRAFEAWDATRGRKQVIAVLDTGVDRKHPDLAGQLVPGIDLVDRGTPPDDANGHGTFVAGIAVAVRNNNEGGTGVAPRANVMPVRVLDDKGRGTSDVVAEGIRWATREGATVINLSLADVPGQARAPTNLITTDVELAIRQAVLHGVVVVAAAGNEGENSTPYNRDLPAVVVGATTRRDRVWEHSNYDDRTLFAPGVGIISTYVATPYAAADGTSFAAPMVAAAAALLRSDGFTESETRRRLTRTARPVGRGAGRVDVAAALGVAKRVRTEPRTADDAQTSPSKRRPGQPRPVPQPSPVESVPQRGEPPPSVSEDAQEDDPGPERRKVAAVPGTTEGQASPSPVPEPTAGGEGALGQGPAQPPPSPAPVWPIGVAGVLLFSLTVALAGYLTARRSV